MRIISGFLKGKILDFINSTTTRPLRDLVRENIFNIIQHSNLINVKINGANILDVYSGIGSFGLECLSRDAKKVTFVEKDGAALKILKKNIINLRLEDKTNVLAAKTSSLISQLSNTDKFEIIFLDPPFAENFYIEDLKLIKNTNVYSKNHLIIIHRESKIEDPLINDLDILITKKYGRSKIIFATF